MITVKKATSTLTRSETAKIWDGGARHLTIGHLREFLAQVELTGLDDETPVRLTNELSSGGSWHTIEITATRSGSDVIDLGPVPATSEDNTK